MRTKPLAIILIALLAVSVGPNTQTVYSQVQPSIVYVDADNIGGTGTVDDPYDTISTGITIVAPGGTVIVAPGTYIEALTITKSLTLRGSGLDVTTIDGRSSPTGRTISVQSSGLTVTVEHFKITGGGSTPTDDCGLRGFSGSTMIVRWNWFTGNGLHGVISPGPDVIEHNLFTNNGDGQGSGYAIWATSGSTAQIRNNTIRRSTAQIGETGSNRVRVGIAIYGSTDPGAPDIRNNVVYDVDTGIGIVVGSSAPGMTLDYNIVYSNTTNYGVGVTPGTHDQQVDPRLTTTSYLNTGTPTPAVDGGDPAPSFNDRDGSRNDVGMRQFYMTGGSRYGNFSTESVRQPLGLAAYKGSAVWMSSYIYEPGIYRLDAANGDPLQKLTVPGALQYEYGGLTYDGGTDRLFHSTIYGDGIQVLNGGTGAISATLPFTVSSGGDLAYDGTSLWQAAGGWMDPQIYKINATTGATEDAFTSPVPGQTQVFGLAYTNNALWLSKDDRIYKIDPATEAVVCSFEAPVADVRGLAFIPGYDMLASSFSGDQVRRFDLPTWCDENTQPGATIDVQWSDGLSHTLQYQPAYSNEAVCLPRDKWAQTTLSNGNLLPKSTGGTIRGLRLRTGNPVDASVVVSGTQLSGATLTWCEDGTWGVWSASPTGWTGADGALWFDWAPRPLPGISIDWGRSGAYTQTLRYQYQDVADDPCTPDRKAWSNVTLNPGDYLPLPVGSRGNDYNGLLLDLEPGDDLQAQLDSKTHLERCGKTDLWRIYSDTAADFVRAYGTVAAAWSTLPDGKLTVAFQGTGAGEPQTIEWQDIGDGESACGDKSGLWKTSTLQSGDALPMGSGRGIRVKVSREDLLNVKRAESLYTQECDGGVSAIYAVNPRIWEIVRGGIIIDWAALYLNLDCVWFQQTETVDHSRDQSSHLWCQDDGTVTVFYEGGTSDTVAVVDGYARIPAGVDRVRPGGLYAGDLTATLQDRLPLTMHVVPVNLVDVGIDAPTIEILWLAFDLINLPYFDITWDIESDIDVEGNTANQIWNNMETAMNGQPAVVGTDAYMLVASSADSPVDYELWFGQGPFDSWKGMFFLEHPTTFIHELLHSLTGLKHVGGAPGPDPAWPYGNTRTFPEESTYYGPTQPGSWERLHFTGDDCDALMSYGNSNPYGLGTDYRVRCLSPFTGDRAWTEVNALASASLSASAASNGPVMWLEGPDLFRFTLAHTESGNTGSGPDLIANPDTIPMTITVPSYETHHGYLTDSFVNLQAGVNTAVFDGRHYPPAFGTIAGSSVVSDTYSRALTVTTECGWLLSTDEASARLLAGPYVGSRTITVYDTRVDLQLSCADGESAQAMVFPRYVYLPLVRR